MSSHPVSCAITCFEPLLSEATEASVRQQLEAAMAKVSAEVVAEQPACVLVISPTTSRMFDAYGIVSGETIEGDFSLPGRGRVSVAVKTDARLTQTLRTHCVRQQVEVLDIPTMSLDAGAFVPLWSLQAAGLSCPVILCALPMEPSRSRNRRLGDAIQKFARDLGKPCGVVISGHVGALGNADAIVEAMKQGDWRRAVGLLADEDGDKLSLGPGLEIAAAAGDFVQKKPSLFTSVEVEGVRQVVGYLG